MTVVHDEPGRDVDGRAPATTAAAEPPEAVALEVVVSRVLRAGVVLSSVVLGIGLVLALVHGPLASGDVDRLTGTDAAAPRSLPAVLGALVHGRLDGLLLSGLAVLIATPLVRVAASVWAYHRAHDHLYLALTSVVAGLLVLSVVLGAG